MPHSPFLWKAYTTLDIAVGVTSIYTMAGISLLRFIAVKFPLKANFKTSKTCALLIFTWLVGITISAARFALENSTAGRIYMIVLFVFVYMVPLACIASAYAIVAFTLAKKRSETAGTQISQSAPLTATVNRTIVITIVCFIVCYTPFMILNVLGTFDYAIPLWLWYVIRALHYTNSIVNFFVYATKIHEFRLAAKSLICHHQDLVEAS